MQTLSQTMIKHGNRLMIPSPIKPMNYEIVSENVPKVE
jgi:hypothetical protein